ncbi:MAG: DNA starvation/stationary phase protection protein [Bacilli bacterium]|nr:DNA starvation/stationary phase protection protein [Bacilli bacterium]
MMDKLLALLNREVANFGVLYIKLHNYHWYVKGTQFYTLHPLFEKLYDEATEHLDTVAERMLMLGGKPAATLKEFLELATIKEATGTETTNDMIKELIKDFELIVKELDEVFEIGDEVTKDMVIGIQSSFQKHIWMLKTYLM